MGYNTSDHVEIINRLMVDGAIDGDKVLEYYGGVLAQLEEIIVRENLVTLPEREAGIRVASAAETAAFPVPYAELPPLINNTGEFPYFVLPLIEQNEDGTWQKNGFVYEAFAWTLTAHEARPGHEMQFSAMIESGVSNARAIFAVNSATTEGWGVYSEWTIMYPYMPIEAQLCSLQSRLWRAARMFLDPQLNLGLTTQEEVSRVFVEEVGLTEGQAQAEVNRYTFQIPGQATAYTYGFLELQELRAAVELELGDSFDQQPFHDCILAQGILPFDILKSGVMEEFVPSVMASEETESDSSSSTNSRTMALRTRSTTLAFIVLLLWWY
ncbi:Bacterial protein of unknown function (DUF885) [Seminavis robusta]|uniref:DUF885 domain-containing protein n=1 Tax=Seminavis robusta TaxID=568900 RepID=A0A9N8EEC5_9STRA|nr:Bacterial protein of unknown function (DUF885) [Seminavis robusta]|eukprot:Sro952_g224110.1 Bacterial protein of unknown function (DUF885) (326) ;mRNA; r:33240-34217